MTGGAALACRLALLASALGWCGSALADPHQAYQTERPIRDMPVRTAEPTAGIVRLACPAMQTKATAFMHRSGRLLTTDGAVDACRELVVILDSGAWVKVDVVARDPYADLAMLVPAQPLPGPALSFAPGSKMEIGALVKSWGFPAFYSGPSALLNVGYVSGFQRSAVTADRQVTKMIIGGTYSPGLAGSPLVDASGAVTGIVSGRLSPISDVTATALRALKRDAAMSFVVERSDGAKETLFLGQMVAIILEELQLQMQALIGIPLDELERFMAANGIEP